MKKEKKNSPPARGPASFHSWSAPNAPWPSIGIEPEDMSWQEKTRGIWSERFHLYDQPVEEGKPVEVEVTEDDIAKGIRYMYSNSPVALAINRTCGGGNVVTIFTRVQIRTWWYTLPEVAQRFVKEFDGRKRVKPFRFTCLPVRRVGPVQEELWRASLGRPADKLRLERETQAGETVPGKQAKGGAAGAKASKVKAAPGKATRKAPKAQAKAKTASTRAKRKTRR